MVEPLIEKIAAALGDLLDQENRILATSDALIERAGSNVVAGEILSGTRRLAAQHIQALSDRGVSAKDERDAEEWMPWSAFDQMHPAANSLRIIHALVQDAALRYSLLQPITHRARDSWVVATSGTSAHLCRQHTQEYVQVMGDIAANIHDIVIGELEDEDFTCTCTCPCCSIGVCLCGASARLILSEAWSSATPPNGSDGIEFKTPRAGSSAAAAPFLKGDVIVGVDGKRIANHQSLQQAVLDHAPGDSIEFIVRRPAGETGVFVAHRREGYSAHHDECTIPSGQQFHVNEARKAIKDVKARSTSNGSTLNGADLSALSPRQMQVLSHIARGFTNAMIAEEMEIKRATVARHVESILEKTGTTNRTAAAALAFRAGLAPAHV
jgi:DNA-binding CsgD family transcriptional regulator